MVLNLTKAKSIDQTLNKTKPSLYLSIAIFYKLDIAPTTLGSEMYNHEQTQKAVHKNIWMPNECL